MLTGAGTSPGGIIPSWTTRPPGRTTRKSEASATGAPVASKARSNQPLSASWRASRPAVVATLIVSSATSAISASGSSVRSVMVMWLAPMRRTTRASSIPIGPAPAMTTRLPATSPPRRAPWIATASGSAMAAVRKDMASGIGTH